MTDATAPSGTPDVDSPTDETTLVAVIEGFHARGYVTDFGAQPLGRVRCDHCGSVLDASAMSQHSLRRLEGASDPDDMLVVVATSCSVCGARGTLVLGFGPMASEDDTAILQAMNDGRHDHRVPAEGPSSEEPTERVAGTSASAPAG